MKASERAAEYLHDAIAVRAPAERLPPLRSMATACGVSYPTMQAAVRRLCMKGLLVSRQGSGVVVSGGNSPERKLLGSPQWKWERVAQRLRRLIVTGALPPGQPLSSLKSMRLEFGVGYQTLMRALQSLADEGLLVSHARTYRVTSPVAGEGQGTVVLILRGGPDGEVVFPSPRSQDNFRDMEIACARAGVHLALVTFSVSTDSRHSPTGHHDILSGRARNTTLLGYVVWTSSIPSHVLSDIAGMLVRTGLPIALFDEGEDSGTRGGFGPHCRHFLTAHDSRAGEHMADFLVGLGHTRVLFVSAHDGIIWSEARREGMRRAFGTGARLYRHPVPSPAPPGDDGSVRDLIHFLNHDADPSVRARFASVTQTFVRHEEDLRVFHGNNMSRVRHASVLPHAWAVTEREGITAWAAENDQLALEAMAFLVRRGVRVPQDISVAGFDDSPAGRAEGLTSYSFSGRAYVNAMLNHVLGMQSPVRSRGTVVLDGVVMARNTTARIALHDRKP